MAATMLRRHETPAAFAAVLALASNVQRSSRIPFRRLTNTLIGRACTSRLVVNEGRRHAYNSLPTAELAPLSRHPSRRPAWHTAASFRDERTAPRMWRCRDLSPARPRSSPLCPEQGPDEVSRLIPRMLLDIQNRGQLSAGMTSFNPHRNQLIDTYKELGGVSEVFRLSHRGKYESLMREYAGRAAIGQVRYATCGAEDRSYAQPFERHHVQKHKWFSFAFNGQLANYQELRQKPAGRRRQPPGPRHRHRNHHARDQPRAVGRPPADADRDDAEHQPAVRRGL